MEGAKRGGGGSSLRDETPVIREQEQTQDNEKARGSEDKHKRGMRGWRLRF